MLFPSGGLILQKAAAQQHSNQQPNFTPSTLACTSALPPTPPPQLPPSPPLFLKSTCASAWGNSKGSKIAKILCVWVHVFGDQLQVNQNGISLPFCKQYIFTKAGCFFRAAVEFVRGVRKMLRPLIVCFPTISVHWYGYVQMVWAAAFMKHWPDDFRYSPD